MDIQIGDRLKMKKKHPCGSTEWDVLRVGIDFRLKCCGCGHMIMVARKQAEKNIRRKWSISLKMLIKTITKEHFPQMLQN